MLVLKRHKLITVREAAEMLSLAEKTVHNRAGGTAKLTRVYQGRSVRLIKSEVEDHLDQLIEKAARIAKLTNRR